MKIWQRYFVYEMLKTFLLFIFSFYGLYVLIDYASHLSTSHYHHASFQPSEVFLYYGSEFIRKSDILIPFALLLSTIKSLSQMNLHNELVALMVSGVSRAKLIRPFIAIGFIFCLLLYFSNQYIYPIAAAKIRSIEEQHHIQRHKKGEVTITPHMVLPDGSIFLYQDYERDTERFTHLFWIKRGGEIIRMNYFYPLKQPSYGEGITHFKRNSQGVLKWESFSEMMIFPSLKFDRKQLFETLTAPIDLPISDLFKKLPKAGEPFGEKEATALTILYKKLTLPWLCLLAVVGPAPFCLRFSRGFQVFFLYALSIFSLVAVYLLLDAPTILGKRQLLSPFWAIVAPLLLAAIFIGYRYRRLSYETV